MSENETIAPSKMAFGRARVALKSRLAEATVFWWMNLLNN